MVTNQLMTRKMGEYDVLQRTKDGYFNATVLFDQFNRLSGATEKQMNEFLSKDSTYELIEEIKRREGNSFNGKIDGKSDFQVVTHSRIKIEGQKGRPKDNIYMHPVLFIDFAMWLNPRFRYDVIKFCYDQMVKFRNDAGDAYRELSAAVQQISSKCDMQVHMKKVAEALNYVVFGNHYPSIRNDHGTEEEMQDLLALERRLTYLINDGFITDFDSLINYLRQQWLKRRTPNCLK